MGEARITLPDEAATAALGRALAPRLAPGRPLLLSGPLGAGKSHLARAAIRALTREDQEVPSPTFTLVQAYGAEDGIWHADLYRLGDPSELAEIGLDEAFGTARVLLEWPERLEERPAGALLVTLSDGDPREARLSWSDPAWDEPARAARAEAFARIAGLEGPVAPLPADWSSRRYARAGGAIVMDTSADEARRSADVFGRLSAAGLAAPAVLAGPDHGLLATGYHGDVSLAAHLEAHPADEVPLYEDCAEALLRLRDADASGLPRFGPAEMARAAAIADLPGAWRAPLEAALRAHDAPPVMILRDFHAENVILRDGEAGIARIGLIDTQDAMLGHPAYDLASLLWDARRDVSRAAAEAATARFVAGTGVDPGGLGAELAVLCAQRAIRILGRIDALAREGRVMPAEIAARVRGHLAEALRHPALEAVAREMRADAAVTS